MDGSATVRNIKRVRWSRSNLQPLDLEYLQGSLALSNRELARELGVGEIMVSNYRTGVTPIPMVVEKALCFLVLRRALLVHEVVRVASEVGRLDSAGILRACRALGVPSSSVAGSRQEARRAGHRC